MELQCKYCSKATGDKDTFDCSQCRCCVHSSCLRSPPADGFLAGDVFFDFKCANCSQTEILTRKKLQWIMVVIITLHNLSKFAVPCHGFFHFRSHISNFIEKNFAKFFPNMPKRKRKNLLGTIAGVLSQHSPETFVSGTETVGSIGWWKLCRNWSPREYDKHLRSKSKRSHDSNEEDEETEVKKVKVECHSDPEDELQEPSMNERFLIKQEDKIEEVHIKQEVDNDESKEKQLVIKEEMSDEAMYKKLELIIASGAVAVPPSIHEFYRNLKSRIKVPSPIIEPSVESDLQVTKGPDVQEDSRQLGRYFKISNSTQRLLLCGPASYHLFTSPYSNNLLHPFIYRDKKMLPCWLKVMCEMKFAINESAPERSSIDFCYLSAHHITAVNSLLQETFWPGIDMSEALSYPDFTVVALYKKLVIGCAFMVPDACHNATYISFLAVRPCWNRSGIATFMLYHLTQTARGKDITLHVSAGNPAICLYQKFGFKTEELIRNFYEKYLPRNSPHSPHALFLRLTR